MKAVINQQYAALAPELNRIAAGHYTPEKVFCNRRNTVELVNIGGKPFVVKRYKEVTPAMGLTYLWRKTKARKAYDNANTLIGNGFLTPAPVAFFERKRCGIFRDCVFISEYVPFPPLSDTLYAENADAGERYWLYRNISAYTLSLHQKGIVPVDFNATNILLEKIDRTTYRFWLIDINRMTTGHVPSLKEGMRAFFQLGSNAWNYGQLLQVYAGARGFALDDCIYAILRARRSWHRLRRIKHPFRR